MTNSTTGDNSAQTSGTDQTESKLMRRTGYGLSILVVLFLIMDITMKLLALSPVTQTMVELGWPHTDAMARGLGVILLICTALYVVPRTSVLGAVLLTAYLGGAVATQVRIGNPLLSHELFGVYLGLFVWGGLYLRDARLRALFPLRR